MKNAIQTELNKLKKKDYINLELINNFEKRLNGNDLIIRDEGISDHFCAFFVPIHTKSSSIFMGHHIKANLWIPPGGHIDANETPLETAVREIKEELQYTAKPTDLELFNMTTIDIFNNPVCTKHWDLYYLLNVPEMINFPYEKREFSDARWMDIKEANNLMQQHPSYKDALKPLLRK
ncbi:MAG: NUDIX hydrolase [bacterium]|nr:NUDIX hydrolase [bacterium]